MNVLVDILWIVFHVYTDVIQLDVTAVNMPAVKPKLYFQSLVFNL